MDTPFARVAYRCFVSGRVQGVFYRGTAREQARILGVSGYARNLRDGRVEVLAYGAQPAVRQFVAWLWVGPSAAKVSSVSVEPVDVPGGDALEDFTTA